MISFLSTAMFSARRTRTSLNGFVSMRSAMPVPLVASQRFHLQLRHALLQHVRVLPADDFENVELAGAQRRDLRRLVLQDAVGELVDERQLEFGFAELFPSPVDRVLHIGLRVAGQVFRDHERSGAVDVLPVVAARVHHLLREDRGVIAPGEAVIPLGVELLEMEDHRIAVRRLDAFDVIEILGDLARALVAVVVAEQHVLRRQFARLHHAGLVGKHHALAQPEHDGERIVAHLIAFGEVAADRVARAARRRR